MEWISHIVGFVLHIDVHLQGLIGQYGAWVYAILFLIVFCETGLVLTPILPGDSLLFAAGALAYGTPVLTPGLLVLVLISAALLGDNVNYWIGRRLGAWLLARPSARFIKPAYLQKTQLFFDRHGGKAIIIARFMPIVRTYIPFTAGAGRMPYARFLGFSIIGALLWVPTFVYAGFWFGRLPFIRDHFTALILGVVIVSVLPAFIGIVRSRRTPPI